MSDTSKDKKSQFKCSSEWNFGTERSPKWKKFDYREHLYLTTTGKCVRCGIEKPK